MAEEEEDQPSRLDLDDNRISERMSTSYRPDREYVDGVLVERDVGEWRHQRLIMLLAVWFVSHEQQWQVASWMVMRVQVASTRVRVPDAMLTTRLPQPEVITERPVLCVEILSPEDSLAEIKEKAADYFEMGAAAVWIIDPEARAGYWSSGIGSEWIQSTRLEVPGTDIYVELPPLFARLDLTLAP